MSTAQSIVRTRAGIILLIATMLVSLVIYGASVAAASARMHDISFASVPNATPIARGSSASAEAAADHLARILSREHGYQPSSFKVELYRMPAIDQAEVEALFATTIARGDWAAAPELATSETYNAIGWTRASGQEAVVGAYEREGTGDQMVIVILRAFR